MKGLLLKDFYTLTKQMKVFLIIIVVWSFIPGFSTSSFAIIYAAMLPITALAYDERSKWNSLAAMMPYTAESLVFSKYFLGYILVGCTSLLSILAQIIIAFFKKSPLEPDSFMSIIFVISVALIIQALNLPAMFKLGVEKGRYVFFILVAIFIIGGTTLGDKLVYILDNLTINQGFLIINAIVATLTINVISILISIKIYRSKVN